MTSKEQQQTAKPRTESRDVRRKQLIMATIDSISKRGFSGTTLKHVTEGANLSHGVVNYHFENKEMLYVETLGYLTREHYQLWSKLMNAAGPNPAHQLAAIIEADFDKKICSQKKLSVWFAFWGQAKYRPNYLKVHHKFDDDRFVELTRLCGEIIDDGKYPNLNAEHIARTLEALIDGLWLNIMLYPTSAKRQECRDNCFIALAEFFPKHFVHPSLKDGGRPGINSQ